MSVYDDRAQFNIRLMSPVVQKLQLELWERMILPCVQQQTMKVDGVGEEACILWNEILDIDKKKRLQEFGRDRHAALAQLTQKRHEITTIFSTLCVPSLKNEFVLPLLTTMDMMDKYSDEGELNALLSPENELGIHYRQGVVEKYGKDNFGMFKDRVSDMLGAGGPRR